MRVTQLALFLTVLAACSKKDAKPVAQAASKPEVVTVKTVAATTRRIDKTISVTGSLNPDETVNVSFEIAGRVASVNTDFGMFVHKGDILAELNKQEFQFQLDRAKGALAQAYARIGLSPGDENASSLVTPAMRQAQAQLDDARFKFESAAKLVKSGDISQERYTELEKAFHSREAAFDITRDDMRVQTANIESLRADVKLAQKKLSDATVRAPFDGAVTQKLVSAGQYIKENTTVLTLVKASPLRLLVDLPETAAGEVHAGTTLTFTTDAIPNKEFHAAVRQLNPALDSKSRSLTVEARIVDNASLLRPGMFVQVQLVTARNSEVVVIPSEALYTVAGLTKAFIIRGGRALECRVPPGESVNGWTEVPSDKIHPGDLVAVSNVSTLVNGSEVSASMRAGL